MKLNPTQLATLNTLSKASQEYRFARVNLEAELRVKLRLELEEQLSAMRNRRDTAAFRAAQLGIPKSRIGLDGLGTKNPQSATDAIEAGRAILSGTMDDAEARGDLVAYAEAADLANAEPLYVHPANGKPYASNQPFSLGDAPGVYVLTGTADTTGGGGPEVTCRFTLADGWPKLVGDDQANPLFAAFLSRHPSSVALRAAAVEFAARAEAV